MGREVTGRRGTGVGAAARITAAGLLIGGLALFGCGTSSPSESAPPSDAAGPPSAAPDPAQTAGGEPAAEPEADPAPVPADDAAQAEACGWDAAKLSSAAAIPTGQDGDLPDVLVGSWQHTHTDEGAGFEEVSNDHRFVFPSPDRMLYCQHVPGATDYAENAANVTLNGATIELPGGEYGYTVTAWSEDTMVWDNPVGGGYVYLLQRR